MKNSSANDTVSAGPPDGAHLIEAIRAAAEERIAHSGQTADNSIQKMTEEWDADMRRFEAQEAEKCDRSIAREVAKIKNRGNTDRAKRSLILQHDFVLSMIDKAVALLRTDMRDRYYTALSDAVCEAISKIEPGRAIIHIAEEDAALREALPVAIDRKNVVIDTVPEQGGVVVFDQSRRIRYDLSTRRILHRNMSRLKKEMQALIGEHVRKKTA